MQVDVELADLRAGARETAKKDQALEAKACALMRQYGLFLPAQAKAFFRELADHLNWQHLKGQLK
ncbi:hypothetical protein HAV22_21390 [Massilia sp. TW-1]|uniref:Uncharacterized protein n=1 Tax=Telluria antibiotica TaxID=2717319 RepID=A0ABX0PGM6_9BURK|nr:hypothetical protein [Telluria antibiotica]NIA56190.1 hypothetical protein [Telluria antibiotica]